ncbi:MAG: LytTR family DNA-binding domain-containing protein [Paenibacillus dendritiformis]|uniref:LytR/AlgR family response regulator transcription factor n=1 Tax=Paenibacillus dendritiformis TaxID=130049 RepID=UPI00143D88BF|nr:LytTR family DNA-binding domain-containing protein [Paenibacillus dendritiformis]MDU5144549.1 LytTR family DNA-binding domain-containing protein [Paenibacillus dendritiformis]NKI21200.1 response regulator transcription factor [Paenibacillus dendritiformis]NRG01444.1 response regulator transcription factor [Paenibacillus dendritiformis]GIO76059.1 DNA-binding response regulator [Paenibacillus dendritiformis]
MNVAICDDDINVANLIEDILSNMCVMEFSSDVFLSGGDLLRCLQSGSHYNIYLLDIEMPGQNGIEIASVIREQDRDAIIIFITDHKEYVYEVFEVLPFRFLRKPVTAQKLSRILLDAAEHIQVSKQLFFFQIGHDKYQLRCSDILYFEGAGRKVVIHANQDTYEFYGKIADILPQLDTNLFCRIHASILVNMEYIRSIKKMAILLQNETQLPISKRYLNVVKQAHLSFIERRCGNP